MTGKPVSSWLTDALLPKANVLLHQTNQPITDIAFQLSIGDVSYFARVFKKTYWSKSAHNRCYSVVIHYQ